MSRSSPFEYQKEKGRLVAIALWRRLESFDEMIVTEVSATLAGCVEPPAVPSSNGPIDRQPNAPWVVRQLPKPRGSFAERCPEATKNRDWWT